MNYAMEPPLQLACYLDTKKELVMRNELKMKKEWARRLHETRASKGWDERHRKEPDRTVTLNDKTEAAGYASAIIDISTRRRKKEYWKWKAEVM